MFVLRYATGKPSRCGFPNHAIASVEISGLPVILLKIHRSVAMKVRLDKYLLL